MNKFYFTFGQAHAHSVGGFTYDKDVVVVIEAETSNDARQKMFAAFGRKWSMEYDQLPDMKFFPRGIKELR